MKSFARGGVDGGGMDGPAQPGRTLVVFEGGGRADGLRVLRRKVALLKELATELLSEMEMLEANGACEGEGDAPGCLRAEVSKLEIELITRALKEAGWNQAEAARRLGLKPTTLFYKIKCYGIGVIKPPRSAAA